MRSRKKGGGGGIEEEIWSYERRRCIGEECGDKGRGSSGAKRDEGVKG